MDVFEMKRFYIEIIGSVGNTLIEATGDEKNGKKILKVFAVFLTKRLAG